MVGPPKCFLGCVTYTWLVWFVIVWSPSPTHGREPSNPDLSLGTGSRVMGWGWVPFVSEHGKSPRIGWGTWVLVPTLLLTYWLARCLQAPICHL